VVAMSPTQQFEQVSFANGICTFKGGKHVDYIVGQICRKIAALIEKKKKLALSKNSIKVIREHMIVFLRCDVENPSFDSQTKDFLNTPSSAFGSACEVSDAFVEKLAKIGVMDAVCAISELREAKTAKKSDGKKTGSVRGIQNFMDANFAGGPKSKDCVLILCEGLSAMSGVVSGLSAADRNTVGIYPLRGKLLNVRGEQTAALTKNREITELKKIMALETGKEYGPEEVAKCLRYGKIMILTDSDVDGSHIKALCINLFHVEWPSLFRIPGFLSFMNTPILTARRAGKLLQFYNEGEYLTWKAETPNAGAGWAIKYFKGLGTSTAEEFKKYFADKKVVDFRYDYGDEPSRGWINAEVCARLEPPNRDDDCIDKVFNKKRADERKLWLEAYDKTAYLNTSAPSVSYANFVDKELIHFSVYDCARSIPSMVDGLKVSQRKILFAAFKRKMTSEVKVAQFSGYVSEHACYHHGEVSLQGAIVNMAQTFVGSNNINLLEPRGQFGSRLQGGKDSASSRYIFTQLNPLARSLFPHVDDAVLTYTDDDGTLVEPEFYIPIIPFVLINGISGIGTGFSTSIPPYNPRDIVRYLKSYLKCASFCGDGCITAEKMESSQTLTPFYEGFTGTITRLEKHKFLVRGVHSILNDTTVHITELPIDTWTSVYLEKVMEPLMDAGVDKSGAKTEPQIRNFVSNSTDKVVDIVVSFEAGRAAELADDIDDNGVSALEKLLKLTSTVSTSNIHLFDKHGKLRRYSGPEEIVDDFIEVRMSAYGLRKKSLLAEFARRAHKLSNRARYIQLVLDGGVDLRKKSNAAIDEMLEAAGLARIEDSYDYLVQMPMRSVSRESVDKLLREKGELEADMASLDAAPLSQLWLADLAEFEAVYSEYATVRNTAQVSTPKKAAPSKRAAKK
jgi:DNA topoisomerase II